MEKENVTDIVPENNEIFSGLREEFSDNNVIQKAINDLENVNTNALIDNAVSNSTKIEALILGSYKGEINRSKVDETVRDILNKELEDSKLELERNTKSYEKFLNNKTFQEILEDNKSYIKAVESDLASFNKDPDFGIKWFNEAADNYIEAKRNVHLEAEGISENLTKYFKNSIDVNAAKKIVNLPNSVIAVSKTEFKYFVSAQMPGLEDEVIDGFNTTIDTEGKRAIVVPFRSRIRPKDINYPEKGTKVESSFTSLRHEMLHKVCDINATSVYDESNNIIKSNRGFVKYNFNPDTRKPIIDENTNDNLWMVNLDEGAVTLLTRLTKGKNLEQSINELSSIGNSEDKSYIKYARSLAKVVDKVGLNKFNTYYINNDPDGFINEVESTLSREDLDEFYKNLKKIY